MVRRWQVHAGVLLAVSYVFCGMVQDEYQLFAARAFQGVENGYVAAAMTIISDNAEPKNWESLLGLPRRHFLLAVSVVLCLVV